MRDEGFFWTRRRLSVCSTYSMCISGLIRQDKLHIMTSGVTGGQYKGGERMLPGSGESNDKTDEGEKDIWKAEARRHSKTSRPQTEGENLVPSYSLTLICNPDLHQCFDCPWTRDHHTMHMHSIRLLVCTVHVIILTKGGAKSIGTVMLVCTHRVKYLPQRVYVCLMIILSSTDSITGSPIRFNSIFSIRIGLLVIFTIWPNILNLFFLRLTFVPHFLSFSFNFSFSHSSLCCMWLQSDAADDAYNFSYWMNIKH